VLHCMSIVHHLAFLHVLFCNSILVFHSVSLCIIWCFIVHHFAIVFGVSFCVIVHHFAFLRVSFCNSIWCYIVCHCELFEGCFFGYHFAIAFGVSLCHCASFGVSLCTI